MNSNHSMITRSTSVNSLISLDGNTLKRSRSDLNQGSEMGEVTDLADLWSKIHGMFSSSATIMEEKFNTIESKIDSCKTDLEERIGGIELKLAELRNECHSSVQNIAQTVDVMRHDLDITAEGINRLGRSQDILISGVPYIQNENLLGLFRNMANTLGYKDNQLPMVSLRRMARDPIAPGTMPPIVCQFALKNVRDEFYRSYLNLKTLSLRNFGFDSDNRVYINENLTEQARQIRSEALKLKKKGRLLRVYSRDGVVFVKGPGAADAVACHTLDKLFHHVK